MVTKTNISSVLSQDFGVEDFDLHTGALNSAKGQESINDYALSNKLGLMSALADRNDSEVVTFGAEAYNLLGEANQLGQIATAQINNINQRFAIAAEIKKNYGVEGFDPMAFGCEGFGDAIKNAFTAVVAAIKKVIQSITNWIRQVMNWVGSQFAKGQQKLVDKYKKNGNFTFASNAITIKAIVPSNTVKSGTDLINPLNGTIIDAAKTINNFTNEALKVINSGNESVETAVFNKDANGNFTVGKGTITKNSALSSGAKDLKAMAASFKTYYGKSINVIKVGSASKIANEAVWGTEKPNKTTISAVAFLKKVEWTSILSKDDLKATKKLVDYGKALIKVLNESLKGADKLAKSMKLPKDETGSASRNKAVKNYRNAVSNLNNANRIGSLYSGILYATFANYLKLRSYAASAVKALVKETTAKGKKAPKEGSAKDNLAKARAAING